MHHGMPTQPAAFWDYLIVAIAVIVAAVALYLFVRGFLGRGEERKDHIKRRILDDGPGEDR